MEPWAPVDTQTPRAKGISFAFVFSIFLYAIVFYIFNLSPSKLINNTKFWFFISNTLIIIIAADYGAFLSSSSSSSPNVHDLYQEYEMIKRQRSAFSVRTRVSPTIHEEGLHRDHHLHHCHCRLHPNNHSIDLQDKLQPTQKSVRDADERMAIASEFQLGKRPGPDNVNNGGEVAAGDEKRSKLVAKPRRKARRSRSEVNDRRVVFDESRNIVRMIECDKDEQRASEGYNNDDSGYGSGDDEDDGDEYSKLSNEELNKRVEDFINRFNHQIRVQANVYS